MASRNEYRFYVNRTPEVAKARAECCGMYRNLRKANPEIARLLFVRLRSMKRTMVGQLIDNLYNNDSSDQVGGLASLVR